MDTLRIYLFGQLRVYRDQVCLDKFPTWKAKNLFCYLLLHRQHCHARNVLASLFWGNSPEEQARKCLRTTLWRLRSLVEPDREPKAICLIVDNDEVCFNTDCDYWLDVEEFENGLSASQFLSASDAGVGRVNGEAFNSLTKAVELYRGDLLEGCYEDWCLYERERLQGMFLSALAKLMASHRSQERYDEALRCGLRILSYDPLLEEIQREVMRLHCLAGNRAAALRQYRLCQVILAKELGIEPMEETTALYRQICRGEETHGHAQYLRDDRPTNEVERRQSRSQAVHPPLASSVDNALTELRLAQAGFHQLDARFQRAVQTLEDVRQRLPKS